MAVPVYEAEADLDQDCLAEGSLTYACELVPHAHTSLTVVAAAEGVGDAAPPERTNLNQPDLFYFRSVLARTGFNNNSDYLPVPDTWAARASIVDKQLNLNHNKDDLYGHQTDYKVVDAAMQVVDESGDPPDAFAIYDTSVMYFARGSKEKKEQVAKLSEEILAGDWWTSMEAGFNNFDYALAPMPASGRPADVDHSQVTIVKRDETTASLTKYLRQYKNKKGERGPGVLPDGRLIGRVIRDFVFTGKGLVKKPANPSSAIYTLADTPLSGVGVADAGYTIVTEGTHTNMDELKDKLTAAEARVAELTAALAAEKLVAQETVAAKLTVTEEVAKLTEKLTGVTAELASLKGDNRLKDLTVRVKDAYATDDAKAGEIATTLAALTDEAVVAHLETIKGLRPATPPAAPAAKPDVTVAAIEVVADKPTPVAIIPVAPTTSKRDALASQVKNVFKLNLTPAGKAK